MYDEILFPTDGSDGAAVALEHALEQADAHDAGVHVLFVANTTSLGGGAVEGTTVESLRATGERVVADAVDRITDAGLVAESEVREGSPYREILDYADEVAADMIVMGTHGRRGLDRYLLGSVTEKVVRSADVPVLTIRVGDAE
ncbi:universal stress protein [Halorientalis pallida]|uniref:Universal stress protein n=1 Tax=Halorientalis pallida TaxID=2479928 RepID=A0A498KWJ0_9EURY|nr:universal stress protein [Halorientalis pallida]RXK49991.1 universal stress protein [Halorientalis pallida]